MLISKLLSLYRSDRGVCQDKEDIYSPGDTPGTEE